MLFFYSPATILSLLSFFFAPPHSWLEQDFLQMCATYQNKGYMVIR